MEEIRKVTRSISKIQSDLKDALATAGYLIGILIGIIGLVMVFIELNTFYKIYQINQWPIIKEGGIIKDSYMENISNSTGYGLFFTSQTYNVQYYRTRISFLYKVDKKQYLSVKYSYYEPWYDNPIIAKIETDTYKPGTKVNIRVNPKNPEEAYIKNTPYRNYARLSIGIILSLIGFYAIYKI